ncbi:MAG: O-antigen ligase family protein [Candidatus Eiseniibacteriota bacterium]
MSQAIERAAAVSFVLLVAALPWSIAPMSIGVALCGALTLAAWWRPGGARWCHTPVDWPALGWLAALAIATLTAQDPAASAGRITKGFLLAIVPVAAYHGRDPKLARRAIVVLLVSAAAATIFALAKFMAQGAAFPARVRGAVGHPLTYGGQAMLLATLAAALLLRARDRRWKIGAAALLAALAPALLGSFTRSAWIGTIVAFGVILAATRARWLAILAGGLAVLFLVLPSGYRERALSAFDPTSHWNVERVRLWTAGWKIFRDHPVTGVGLQDLHPWIERYHSPEPHEPHGHLHSIYVQIAASMGIVGLAAFGWLAVGLFRTAGRGWWADRRATCLEGAGSAGLDDGFGTALRIAAVAAVAGFLVAGLFEWNFGDEELVDFLFTLVGLAFAAGGWGKTWPGARPSS